MSKKSWRFFQDVTKKFALIEGKKPCSSNSIFEKKSVLISSESNVNLIIFCRLNFFFLQFVVLLFVVGMTKAGRLEKTYLPPVSAVTAGGAAYVQAPVSGSYQGYAGQRGQAIAITRYENQNIGDGTYRYNYETANGISAEETGVARGEWRSLNSLVFYHLSFITPTRRPIIAPIIPPPTFSLHHNHAGIKDKPQGDDASMKEKVTFQTLKCRYKTSHGLVALSSWHFSSCSSHNRSGWLRYYWAYRIPLRASKSINYNQTSPRWVEHKNQLEAITRRI